MTKPLAISYTNTDQATTIIIPTATRSHGLPRTRAIAPSMAMPINRRAHETTVRYSADLTIRPT
ncbi:MAG: hypothetical protein AT713_01545 [Caldivirga sp. JCHS_4]|nr:MAG: hypothetical protein AT713_01545 [Caldivirga sp. JCHS_4]